ncbi:MAG: hypothetical protein QME62_05195, partial [Armatimonadota bacterium]|nr:hypothetical protein [Armatimonadota bacterium]
ESGQGGILVKIDPKARKLTIASTVGKEIPTRTTFIPKWLDLSTWHTLRIEKQEDRIQVYLNDMRKFNIRANLGGGRFELVADACAVQFGWCGFSDYKGPDDGIEKAQSTNK